MLIIPPMRLEHCLLTLLWQNDVMWRQKSWSTLIQVLAYALYKHQGIAWTYVVLLTPTNKFQWKCIKINNFRSRKCIFQCRLQNDGHFAPVEMHWQGPVPIHVLVSPDQTLANRLFGSMPQSLLWRHNGHEGVSNHQPQPFIRRRSKKSSKLRVTGLCAWNSPVTTEFPSQMARKKCFHLMTSS